MTTTTTTIPGQQLHLYGLEIWCDMGVGIGGDRWPAAELFCDFVLDESYNAFFRTLFLNRRVIELGAGNGMAGILIGKFFAPSEVVITDLEDHLGLIEHNITLNKHTTTPCVDNKDNTRAFLLDWLSPEKILGKFDIVLALECIYREPLYGPLIETLNVVCHHDTIVFLGLTRSFGNSLLYLYMHSLSTSCKSLLSSFIRIWTISPLLRQSTFL
jgi:hypothetical protein